MKIKLLAALLLVPWPAIAADLGGNCCADLEERVAELEATVARKGNRKVSLEVSGHVNEAIFFHDIDDAPRAKVSIIPNTNSISRFRFRGTHRLSTEWDAGFLVEVGVGGFDPGGVANRDLKARHSALYLRSKALGTVWLGHTSVASDGAAQIDLSNSAVAASPLAFGPADEALLGISLDVFDGSRRDVVKWISPTLAGFALSASVSNEDAYDVAVRYAGEFGSFRVAGGAAWRRDEGPFDVGLIIDDTVQTWMVSGSVMEIRTGLFASGSYGRIRDFGAGDVNGWQVRGGFEKAIAANAKMTLFGEFGKYELMDETADLYGGGIVFDFGAFDVYGSYRRYEAMGENINTGVIGAKIEF